MKSPKILIGEARRILGDVGETTVRRLDSALEPERVGSIRVYDRERVTRVAAERAARKAGAK